MKSQEYNVICSIIWNETVIPFHGLQSEQNKMNYVSFSSIMFHPYFANGIASLFIPVFLSFTSYHQSKHNLRVQCSCFFFAQNNNVKQGFDLSYPYRLLVISVIELCGSIEIFFHRRDMIVLLLFMHFFFFYSKHLNQVFDDYLTFVPRVPPNPFVSCASRSE